MFALYLCYNEHVFYWLCHWIFQEKNLAMIPLSTDQFPNFNLLPKKTVSLQLVKALSDIFWKISRHFFWKKRTSLFSLCFPLVTSYADGVAFHCYADDTHIYLHIKFNIPSDYPASIFNISASLCSPVFNHLLFLDFHHVWFIGFSLVDFFVCLYYPFCVKHFVRVDFKSAVQINVTFVTVISEPLMEGALNSL